MMTAAILLALYVSAWMLASAIDRAASDDPSDQIDCEISDNLDI